MNRFSYSNKPYFPISANTISNSSVVGGAYNSVGANYASVLAGNNNSVTGDYSVILGGAGNSDNGLASVAIFGNGIIAQAADTFHVSCLNACNTPGTSAFLAPGTIFKCTIGSTLPIGALQLYIMP